MKKVKLKTDDSDALSQLKEILLSEDEELLKKIQAQIQDIRKQINDPELLIETINPVIADALDRKIYESRSEMAEALSPIMGDAIKIQVREAKEDIVDALYPVIGRMISKSVSEAMKKLIENVNETINKTLNFSLWWKHIKAKIFGLSTAEVLLAEQTVTEIRQVFFIEKKSGLLIAHAATDERNQTMDAHAIGGMLTAIKMFAQDAFRQAEEEQLNEITYSDQTIRIDNGKYSYLAIVYGGTADASFDTGVQKLHHKLHNRYYRALRQYEGDNSQFHGIESSLKRFLKKGNENGRPVH